MKWLVCDSLSTPEQFFASHLDSYSHYLREAGEEVGVINWSFRSDGIGPAMAHPEVLFVLDRYENATLGVARLKIAQVAAICNPMPWDVRNPDGSPAYDLVISSIPWMVDEARARGCRAAYMPLAFDTRALVCGMGVKERDIPCLFVGTLGPNHKRREEVLSALGDLVTIAPPTFGRAYFELLARANIVVNPHAEWSRGAINNMRMFESSGMGALAVTDGEWPSEMGEKFGISHDRIGQEHGLVGRVRAALSNDELTDDDADYDQAGVLQHHTYVQRIPRLIDLARSL